MQRQKFLHIVTAAFTLIVVSLTLWSTAWAAEYEVLYKFKGYYYYEDGRGPSGPLVFDAEGNLYGTTAVGGAYDKGTVFKLTANPDGSWTESILYSFIGGGGAYQPADGLLFDAAGNLYGTTQYGGGAGCNGFGCGAVFRLAHNPDGSWTERELYHFSGGADGMLPIGGLTFDMDGNLYGSTWLGGSHNSGTVFKLTPNPDGPWVESVLYNFCSDINCVDGNLPYAGPAVDSAGNLYGTTHWGGRYGYGNAFKLSPNPDGTWTEQVIVSFAGLPAVYPDSTLLFDATGVFYGTTVGSYNNGYYEGGSVFKLTPNPDGSWQKSRVHAFKGDDGAFPYGRLILDGAGNLYGTTQMGGPYDSGTVYRLAPQPDGHWKFTRLHVFKNGQAPYAGLVIDATGNLYGTTTFGGYGYGVVFKITP